METGMRLTNYGDIVKALKGLEPALKSEIVVKAMREAGELINSEAKTRLFATKKGYSKSAYSYYTRAFKVENLKARNATELGGVKVGISKEGYKLRWLQFGTKERSYYNTSSSRVSSTRLGSKHNTGKILGSNFFYGAVKGKQRDAYELISNAILKSLQKNLEKNSKI